MRYTSPRALFLDSPNISPTTQRYQDSKDAVIFAIHVSDSMLQIIKDEEDEDDEMDSKRKKKPEVKSAVHAALEAAMEILQGRIISNPNDMIGIILFGTEGTKDSTGGSNGLPHIYVLMDLDMPDADGIKELKLLLEGWDHQGFEKYGWKTDSESDEERFNEILVPSTEKYRLADVLFSANTIFTTKAPNFSTRKLFIITDDDDPHANNKADKDAALTRARDLYDLGVIIDPFYISYNGKTFDPSKFYEDIIYTTLDDDDTAISTVSGAARLREMASTLRSKSAPKRAFWTSKLEIGPGLTIGVKGYHLLYKQEKARASYVYTQTEKPQIVKGETSLLAEFTAQVVDKTTVKKAYKFGGENILFTDEEMKELRNFGERGIRILGFRPVSKLPFDHNVRSPIFVYPDETDYIGSVRTFTALHNKLVKDGLIAIVWSNPRKGSSPALCALLPSVYNPEETLPLPSGFFMVQLPFADDIRQNPDIMKLNIPNELKTKMRNVVKQLHVPKGIDSNRGDEDEDSSILTSVWDKGYQPEKYDNPSLQWHYRILQAIALEEELPEKPEDKTIPKYRLIDKHTKEQVAEWAQVFEETIGPMNVSVEKEVRGKRLADAGTGHVKRQRAGPVSSGAVVDSYKNGTMQKVRVSFALSEAIADR